jgi:hypothetical protein
MVEWEQSQDGIEIHAEQDFTRNWNEVNLSASSIDSG